MDEINALIGEQSVEVMALIEKLLPMGEEEWNQLEMLIEEMLKMKNPGGLIRAT